MRARLGAEASFQTLDYGASLTMNGVKMSLHPAGHVLGSAQVRLEYKGEVWVASVAITNWNRKRPVRHLNPCHATRSLLNQLSVCPSSIGGFHSL